MITAAGAGSGLDIETIISQLMLLEQRPVNELRSKLSGLDSQLSDIGRLKSAVESLSTAAGNLGDEAEFGAWTSTTSDEDILTVSSADGKSSENHEIEVLSLATAHRVVSAPYDSVLEEVAVGDYTFGSGEESFTVTLEAGVNTLSDFKSAINNAAGNTSVQASILNVDDGSRLVLTALNAGTDNVISAPGDFTELTAAADASFTIDGLAASSSSNTVTDAVPGMTLELKAPGEARVNSTRDMESLQTLLQTFADSYNGLRTTMSSLGQGSLQGDSILRRVESALRTDFFNPVQGADGEERGIFEFGFTFDKTGKLSVDESTMNDAFSENLGIAISVFTDEENGFSNRLVSTLETYTDIDGFFDMREQAIASRDKSIEEQIARYEYRLEQTESRYRREFGAMDALVSQLQANGNYLLQTLANNNDS